MCRQDNKWEVFRGNFRKILQGLKEESPRERGLKQGLVNVIKKKILIPTSDHNIQKTLVKKNQETQQILIAMLQEERFPKLSQ